jgi:hypothetical protein
MAVNLESGIVEIIGVDEQVNTNQFAASVAINLLHDRNKTGVIRSIGFFLNGAAVGLSPSGVLLIMDEDPNVSAGDTDLAVGEWASILGHVNLVNADVISDGTPTGGVVVYADDLRISFHNSDDLYIVFKLTSATQFNSEAADNESLSCNIWYEPILGRY